MSIFIEENESYRIAFDRLVEGKRIRVRRKGFKTKKEAEVFLEKTIKERLAD